MRARGKQSAQEHGGCSESPRHIGRAGKWMTSRRHWSYEADVVAVAALRSAVTGFAADAGVDEATLGDLRLALSEAVTNAVVHSYREDATPGQVVVTATVSDDHFRLVVADRGMGFKPRLDSPGMGTGLPIMAAVTSSLEIRAVEPRGTEVHMSFDR